MKNNVIKTTFWIWFSIILILNVIPNTPEQKIELFGSPFRLDYLEHFAIFFILGILFNLVKNSFKISVILLLISYAILTEVVQLIIPGRTFNPWDFIYNVIGLIAALIPFKNIKKKISRKNWKILQTRP